jgi:hypothetical protein
MSKFFWGIIVAFLGSGLVYFLVKKGLISKDYVEKIISYANNKGKITSATVVVTEKGGQEQEETGTKEEIQRRGNRIRNILTKNLIIGLSLFVTFSLSSKEITKEEREEIESFIAAFEEYATLYEKEMNDIRTNSRRDTRSKVENITPGNDVRVSILIPTKQVILDGEGAKLIKGSPIEREIVISNQVSDSTVYGKIHYDGQIVVGGSISFTDSQLRSQLIMGVEVLTYNTEAARISLCPYFGTGSFGMAVAIRQWKR